MTDTNQLPPLPTPKFTETIRGVPCITLTEHEHLMRTYALQARAQVQGEAFGYIHHFTAHDESGALIDTTWEADGCADPLPHPTFPSMWKWAHCTPFYTTPQPAQAPQAEVTDAGIEQVLTLAHSYADAKLMRYGALDIKEPPDPAAAFSKLRRAILALRPVQVPMTDLPEGDVTYFDGRGDAVDGYTAERVWEILRSHGITTQAKKEGV